MNKRWQLRHWQRYDHAKNHVQKDGRMFRLQYRLAHRIYSLLNKLTLATEYFSAIIPAWVTQALLVNAGLAAPTAGRRRTGFEIFFVR